MQLRVLLRSSAAAIAAAAICLGVVVSSTRAAASPGRGAHAVPSTCPWLNTRLPIARRVSMLMAHMSLGEKLGEMQVDPGAIEGSAVSNPYSDYEGYVPAQPQLCIPDLVEQDGPLGLAAGDYGATQLPSEVALASSWNLGLAHAYGAVNGRQHLAEGIAMDLGPGLNIQRDPRWGRNFEMFSEDPLLTARMGVADIDGIQSQGVMAEPKHFAAYNQETLRNTPGDDAYVSERALHEMYLSPFYAAVTQGHAAAVMCSYALLDGHYSCDDPALSAILDGSWGFTGFLRSDGGANHALLSVNSGLDQERGSDFWPNGPLANAVRNGQVSMATIDDAVSRILGEMFRFDLFNRPPRIGPLPGPVQAPQDVGVAQQAAEQGTVLLRNVDHILPLQDVPGGSVAVIGPDGTTAPHTAGGGSSYVAPTSVVSPLDGITARAGANVAVRSYSGTDPTQAASVAASAQTAIVFASQAEYEGSDLGGIGLPGGENALIEAVAAANPNTIVVLNTGGPVTMPWLSSVKGVLEAWYPGEQDGSAIAAVLYGDVDPGGHLPETFPASLSQLATDNPRAWTGKYNHVDYSPGLDVGYRWDAARHITPLFPFGFGLSYTSFAFSDLRIHADATNVSSGPDAGQNAQIATVSARITNTGPVAGSDVAQLYVDDPAASTEPPEQLEGFQRVTLAPYRSTTVRMRLSGHALSWFDDSVDGWVLSDGRYRVSVGDSSARAGLRLHGSFTVRRSVGARRLTLAMPGSVTPGARFSVTAQILNPGGITQPRGTLRLALPAGWRSVPAARVGPVAPGGATTQRFTVRVPARAATQTTSVGASIAGAGAGGDLSASSSLRVDPAVSFTTPPMLLLTAGTQLATVVTLRSHLAHAAFVDLTPTVGGAVTVSPAHLRVRVPAFGRRTVHLSLSAASTATPGGETISLHPSMRGASSALAALTVAVPYPSLAAAADTVGVSTVGQAATADFDGLGESYSAEALAADGLTPGAAMTVGGVHLTWPDVAAGAPDSLLADGQTIAVAPDPGATELAVVGASNDASLTAPAMIEYTDGTVQNVSLSLDDWTLPPANPSNRAVATMTTINAYQRGFQTGSGVRNRLVSIFGTTIRLLPGKTIAAVTLPIVGNSVVGDAMHVFTLGVG